MRIDMSVTLPCGRQKEKRASLKARTGAVLRLCGCWDLRRQRGSGNRVVVFPGALPVVLVFFVVRRRFRAIAAARLRFGDENAVPSDAPAAHEPFHDLSPASRARGAFLESGSGKGAFMIRARPNRFLAFLFFIHGTLSLSVC